MIKICFKVRGKVLKIKHLHSDKTTDLMKIILQSSKIAKLNKQ